MRPMRSLADSTNQKFPSRPLESEIAGRETELGAAVDRRGLLEVVRSVRADRLHVAPGALDRVVEENAPTSARLEQAVDRAQAPVDGLRDVPAVAGPPRERNLLPGARQAHHFLEVLEETIARRSHLGGGFRQLKL